MANRAVLHGGPYSAAALSEQARRHLWMHFTRIGDHPRAPIPIIVSGEGCYVYDADGKRYLDGLSALYCVNAGHCRPELAAAAAERVEVIAIPAGERRTAAEDETVEERGLAVDRAGDELIGRRVTA